MNCKVSNHGLAGSEIEISKKADFVFVQPVHRRPIFHKTAKTNFAQLLVDAVATKQRQTTFSIEPAFECDGLKCCRMLLDRQSPRLRSGKIIIHQRAYIEVKNAERFTFCQVAELKFRYADTCHAIHLPERARNDFLLLVSLVAKGFEEAGFNILRKIKKWAGTIVMRKPMDAVQRKMQRGKARLMHPEPRAGALMTGGDRHAIEIARRKPRGNTRRFNCHTPQPLSAPVSIYFCEANPLDAARPAIHGSREKTQSCPTRPKRWARSIWQAPCPSRARDVS